MKEASRSGGAGNHETYGSQMPFEHEAGRLRAMVQASASVWYTKHATEEMKKDEITRIDVETMLGRCSVSLIETIKEETWRAEGTDFDGRRITAVVVAYPGDNEIKVITAWSNEARR